MKIDFKPLAKKPSLPKMNDSFTEFLKRNSEEILKWPKWKRDLFNGK